MTENEAQDVLKRISAAYSRFEVTEMVIEVWVKQLSKMDYRHVLFNLEKHLANQKWPPTIAEIAAFPKPKNEFLEQVEQWEREAKRDRERRS